MKKQIEYHSNRLKNYNFGTSIGMVFLAFILLGCDKEQSPTGIVFNHEQHLGKGHTCALCHLSRAEIEPEVPDERVCEFCHQIGSHEKPDRECAVCHTRVDFKSEIPARATFSDNKFNHEVHTQAGIDCQSCHTDQEKARVFKDIVIPDMRDCTECHSDKNVSNECSACHEYWREDIKPENHDDHWMNRHGLFAVNEFDSNCDYCHTKKTFCSDCHQAMEPASHNLFFKNRGHGFFAEVDRMDCQPCHQQDFCMECHNTETGMKPASHTSAFGGNRPYLHCTGCHFPAGEANGCDTCHSSAGIQQAHIEAMDAKSVPNVPEFVIQVSMSCLDGCHPYEFKPPHHPLGLLSNSDCLPCHLR